MKNDNELHTFTVVKHHNIALLFASYANTQSLTINIEKYEDGFRLLCDSKQLNKVDELFCEFVKNPHQSKYQLAAWEQAKPEHITIDTPSLLTVFKSNLLAHAGIFTLIIFMLCWLIYLLGFLGLERFVFQELKFYTQLSFLSLIKEPYRIVTPILLHFSLIHIAFNTIWWWKLGGEIENKIGTFYLILLLVTSAVISNTGQFIVSGSNFGGLSGVVYALVGFVWCIGHLQPKAGLQLSNFMMGFLIIWLALGFLNWLPINTANMAHLLGLLTGCVMAFTKSRQTYL